MNTKEIAIIINESHRDQNKTSCYYKADGVVQEYEREQLHGRFLKLTRETIEILAR